MKLIDIVSLFLLLSIVFGFILYPKIKPKTMKFLVLFLSLSSIPDIFWYLSPVLNRKISPIIYSLLTPIGYITYAFILNKRLSKKKWRYYYTLLTFCILFLYSLYNVIFNLKDTNLVNNIFLLNAVMTLIVVLLYFFDLIYNQEVIIIRTEAPFWVATGLLFFLLGNVVSTGFFSRIIPYNPNFAKTLYMLNFILNIVQSILFIIGFYVSTKNANG